jgi:hypothetical protein
MIECPVCKKPLQDDFALNGHLRLSKDSDHQAYYMQQKQLQKAEYPTQLDHNPELKPSPTVDLRTFLKKYAANHQENQELCAFIGRALETDRKIREQELEYDYEQREEELQRDYTERKQELNHEYETFKKDFIKEKNEEYTEYKQRHDEDYQKKANGLQHSVNVAFEKGLKTGSLVFHCANYGHPIIIEPNSELEALFHQFLGWLVVVCPDCNYQSGHPYLFWHRNLNCPPPQVKIVGNDRFFKGLAFKISS